MKGPPSSYDAQGNPQYFASSTPATPGAAPTPGTSYIGPDGKPVTYDSLLGTQGAGSSLGTQLAPSPTGPDLAKLQRDYQVKTGDVALGNFGSFLDAYRAGTPTAQIPTTGTPQTAEQTAAMDFASSVNTYIGGTVAGNSNQSSNWVDYVQGLRASGLSEADALKAGKAAYEQDSQRFNQRVAAPKPIDYIAISHIKNA